MFQILELYSIYILVVDKKMIRLFVGIEPPESIKKRLLLLKGGIPNARWIQKENLHLTLQFIGEVEESQAVEIDEALLRIETAAFDITLSGVGFFGSRQPRILWTGAEKTAELEFLFKKVEAALMQTGIEPEGRKFNPHITIARLKGARKRQVMDFVSNNSLFKSDMFHVKHFTLFSSMLSHKGAQYTAERTYSLKSV